MPRSVEKWIGATPDSAIAPRVRIRLWDAAGGRCASCGRKIMAGERWDLDHIVPLILNGEHSEANLQVLCRFCQGAKTAEDVAEKAKVAAVRRKHLLPRQPSRLKSAGFPKREGQHTATRPVRRSQ